MALPYLHCPPRSAEDVAKLVAQHAKEDEHLDFKATFWGENQKADRTGGEEAAKDIAAFANANGGTVVVGVWDGGDQAGAWNKDFQVQGRKKQLEDWLHSYLIPAELANHIEVIELQITTSTTQEALVVTIPPWPYGVAGVRKGRPSDPPSYSFPIRIGRDTKFMNLEEALARTDATRRSTHLRLKRLVTEAQKHSSFNGASVAFVSPIGLPSQEPDQTYTDPGHEFKHASLVNGAHGAIASVGEDAFEISMEGYGTDFEYNKLEFLPHPHYKNEVAPPGALLSVPYELVAAIWLRSDNKTIQIALKASVVLQPGPRRRRQWVLHVSGAEP